MRVMSVNEITGIFWDDIQIIKKHLINKRTRVILDAAVNGTKVNNYQPVFNASNRSACLFFYLTGEVNIGGSHIGRKLGLSFNNDETGKYTNIEMALAWMSFEKQYDFVRWLIGQPTRHYFVAPTQFSIRLSNSLLTNHNYCDSMNCPVAAAIRAQNVFSIQPSAIEGETYLSVSDRIISVYDCESQKWHEYVSVDGKNDMEYITMLQRQARNKKAIPENDRIFKFEKCY